MIAKRFARSVSHLNDICIAVSFTDYDDIKSIIMIADGTALMKTYDSFFLEKTRF